MLNATILRNTFSENWNRHKVKNQGTKVRFMRYNNRIINKIFVEIANMMLHYAPKSCWECNSIKYRGRSNLCNDKWNKSSRNCQFAHSWMKTGFEANAVNWKYITFCFLLIVLLQSKTICPIVWGIFSITNWTKIL